MKRQITVVLLVLFLIGCSNELDFIEVDVEHTNHRLQELIREKAHENGYYSFSNNKNHFYVLLNGINVEQDHEAAYYTDVNVTVEKGILYINFTEGYTSDLSNDQWKHQQLIQIKSRADVDTIELIRNGESVPFTSVVVY